VDQLAAVSADGTLLAMGTRRLRLWDVETGKSGGELFDKIDRVEWVAFSPDRRYLAGILWDVALGGYRLVMWELLSRQVACRLEAHKEVLSTVAFAPDGATLAVGQADGTVRLWNPWTGETHRFSGHRGPVVSLGFTHAGRRLVSGGDDATALVWDVSGRLGVGPGRLTEADLQEAWRNLGADAAKAHQSIARLLRARGQAEGFLSKQLLSEDPDPRLVARLIGKLGDDDANIRSEAMKKLEDLGDRIEPAIQAALKNTKDPDVRLRLNVVLRTFKPEGIPPRRLRILRSLLVLEQLGTEESRRLLGRLVSGQGGLWVQEEARTVQKRIKLLRK
jgi:WD40 repeat protein